MIEICSNCLYYHSGVCRKCWEIVNQYTMMECMDFEMGISSIEISPGVGA